MGMIFLILVLTMVVCVIISNNKSVQTKVNESVISVQNQYQDCMEYNEKEQELVVHKPCTYFSRCLFTQPYVARNYGYEKEKYIYTSATVGGITTGGVHKTGGNYVEKHKSTKVQLIYYYYKYGQSQPNKNIVKKIRLANESLIQKAKNSSIRKYMDGNYIIVEEKENKEILHISIMFASAANDNNMAMNFMESSKIETLPSREKCFEIIQWLSV